MTSSYIEHIMHRPFQKGGFKARNAISVSNLIDGVNGGELYLFAVVSSGGGCCGGGIIHG